MREIELPGYRVTVASGALERLRDVVRATSGPAHRYAVITDENVGRLYGDSVRARLDDGRSTQHGTKLLTIPAGERHKTRATWADLTDRLLDMGFGRDSAIVALGGGVVGDIAGFVAATFMRGIPCIQLPTTLLAMIDASVGGKTGVDTPAGKNLVGAFHRPAAVFADTATLATLPVEQLCSGLAEAIKHGVIADESYFEETARDAAILLSGPNASTDAVEALITRSIEIKADIVRRDEHESGIRKVLNFGHTIGHALETSSGYKMLHGEAVAIGMILEATLGESMGVTEPGTADRIRAALERAGLPTARPAGIEAETIERAMRADKKARGGGIELALPARIGTMAGGDSDWTVPVSSALVREVLG